MSTLKYKFDETFGLFFGFILLLIAIPFIIIFYPFVLWSDRKYKKEYNLFLNQNNGVKFFCYTSRQNSRIKIEKELIPNLSKDIHIIFLHGKVPQSEFPEKHISFMLRQIKNKGFPNMILVKNSQVIDFSLKKEVYNQLNQNIELSNIAYTINKKLNSI